MSQIKTIFSIEGSDFHLLIFKKKALLLDHTGSLSSQAGLMKYYKENVKSNIDLSNKKVYVYPENNITKNHWDSIKNLNIFKRTLKAEDADYKLLSFKAFNKSFLPQWRGVINSKDFIEKIEKDKEHLFYKFSLISTLGSGHQKMLIKQLNNYVEELKKTLSEGSYVYKNTFYIRGIDNNDYSDWDFNKLYKYFSKVLLQMSLQNCKSEDYFVYFIKEDRINTVEEFISSSNYIDEESIFKTATKDLAVIDKNMYNSINQMLKSSDKGNKQLAISIMLNVDFDKSFGYLCLIMYENISHFSSNREWFSSSAAKSFLTRFNSTADELLKSTVKYHDFKGASLAKSIESPSTFVALLKESGHNTSDILEIVKEIMLKDFKNFINSSWMNKIINHEQLFQAFDFSDDVKEHKGE